MKSKLILIAAGGTGGHIYPALAIAQAIQRLDSTARVEFIGTPHGLENQLIPREGFTLHHIQIGRLNRNVRFGERLRTLLQLPLALIQSSLLVLKKRPHAVLGVGGFVTGPALFAAALLGRRCYLWEPNAHAGMANRLLSPFMRECLVVFDQAALGLRSKRITKVGVPVRPKIHELSENHATTSDTTKLHVLIFGGSQGAKAINDTVSEALCSAKIDFARVDVVHQTGANDYARISQRYRDANVPVEVHEYLYDMEKRYAWASLVFARSGTGTVSEISAAGKAAVMIPLPTAADNHQQKNTEALLSKGAAVMILQKDFTPNEFARVIEQFYSDRERLRKVGEAARQFYQPHADVTIARKLLEATS